MVENLIKIYFSSEIDINIDMKFDQALKPRIILEYTAIRIIISSISAGVCDWGFLIFVSILLSEICPSLSQDIPSNFMLRLPQMAILGV